MGCQQGGREPPEAWRQLCRSEDIRAEYDFSHGVRGKHHQAYQAGTNVVFLEPDIAKVFADSASVNQILRLLLHFAKNTVPEKDRPGNARRTSRARKAGRKSRKRARSARG